MHLSKKKIIKSEDAANYVFDYMVQPIKDYQAQKQISSFTKISKDDISGFEMDPLLALRTGVAEKQKRELEEKVEARVLEELQKLEEKAYNDGYKYGYDEGFEKGFNSAREDVEIRLQSFDEILNQLNELRYQMIIENEAQIVRMAFILAAKIAMKEIEHDRSYIVHLLKNLSDSVQKDQESILQMNEQDYEFVQKSAESFGRSLDFMKTIKVEVQKNFGQGECLLESNYGIIDARLQERMQNAWDSIQESIPKTKSDTSVDMNALMQNQQKSKLSVVAEENTSDTNADAQMEETQALDAESLTEEKKVSNE